MPIGHQSICMVPLNIRQEQQGLQEPPPKDNYPCDNAVDAKGPEIVGGDVAQEPADRKEGYDE